MAIFWAVKSSLKKELHIAWRYATRLRLFYPPPKAGTGGGDGKKENDEEAEAAATTDHTDEQMKEKKEQFEKAKEDTWGNHRRDPSNEATYGYFVD